MDSLKKTQLQLIVKKIKAKQLKEQGNKSFEKKKYLDADRLYSQAIELDPGSRPLWTNRAACRNTMEKYEEAISDCDTALSIDPNCSRSITVKGNALLSLRRFDAAKEVYESLRSLGENSSPDLLLKKLHDVQDRISLLNMAIVLRLVLI